MLCVKPRIGNTRLMTDYRRISAYRPRLAMRQMPRYRIKIGIWRNLAATPIHHRRVTYPAVRRTNIILSSVPRAYNDGRGGTSANRAMFAFLPLAEGDWLVGKQSLQGILFAHSFIQRVAKFGLDVMCQPSAFARPSYHLVCDLLS